MCLLFLSSFWHFVQLHLQMEDTPNGQFGQRVVSRAQVVFDTESAAAQTPNHKMVGRNVLYLVLIKK